MRTPAKNCYIRPDMPNYDWLPIHTAQIPPPGIINHIKNHYWPNHPLWGIPFYAVDGFSPQCNQSESLARRIFNCSDSGEFAYCQIVLIPSVFYPVNPFDYRV